MGVEAMSIKRKRQETELLREGGLQPTRYPLIARAYSTVASRGDHKRPPEVKVRVFETPSSSYRRSTRYAAGALTERQPDAAHGPDGRNALNGLIGLHDLNSLDGLDA